MPGDYLSVDVDRARADAPITGQFLVQPDGILDLGPEYGEVEVFGSTLAQAKQRVLAHLKKILKYPTVSLQFGDAAAGESTDRSFQDLSLAIEALRQEVGELREEMRQRPASK